MAVDRTGRTIGVGDVYLTAGQVVRIEGDRVLVRDAAGAVHHLQASQIVTADAATALPPHEHEITEVVDLENTLNSLSSALAGKQAKDALLTALADLVTAANKVAYFVGPDAVALADFTAQARTFCAAADAAAQRLVLALGAAATRNVIGTGDLADAMTLISWFALISHSHDASAVVSGTLPPARGGTGLGSFSKGDLLVWDGSAFTKLAIGSAGQILTVGAGGMPFWATPIA